MAKMGEIAGWIGVDAPALEAEITEVSNIEGAEGGSLVFAMDGEALTEAVASKAGAILANRRLEDSGDSGRTDSCGWRMRGMLLRWWRRG